jgi:hypothetical protein
LGQIGPAFVPCPSVPGKKIVGSGSPSALALRTLRLTLCVLCGKKISNRKGRKEEHKGREGSVFKDQKDGRFRQRREGRKEDIRWSGVS